MDQPLLNAEGTGRAPRNDRPLTRAMMVVTVWLGLATLPGLIGCDPFGDPFGDPLGDPFRDPLSELDPALRDTTLTALSPSESGPVVRRHILESYGSYGCVSCPDAEARLAPYFLPHLGSPAFDPELVVVNYHVKFGSITDPWVTPAIQAWHDRNGYVSLPQAVMDGSNASYGIREKDVAFKTGEYDSLVARARRSPGETRLGLRIDTLGIAYDTISGRIRFRFEVRNLDRNTLTATDFRVLVVKNKPAIIPIYPTPWEVIVMETTDVDADGKTLALTGLPGLTAKFFRVAVTVPAEAGKHVRPPPLGPETLTDYALVILARNAKGAVLNVTTWKYRPN